MRLEDLKKSLLDMTQEEILAKVRAVRADRIIRKTTKAQKVAKVRSVGKMETLLASLSPEELAKLLEEFE